MNKIFVIGDLHANSLGEMRTLNTSSFPIQKELTKEDYVIQTGDFGFIWNNVQSDEEKYWIDWINNRNYTFLFIDGNHDNFPVIWSYPEIEKFGGIVNQISDSIFYLQRGQVYTIGDKVFWVMGGAQSIDKNFRKEGISWWKEEIPNFMEMKKGMESLEKVGWNVDYAITHDAPKNIRKFLFSHHYDDPEDSLIKYLDEIFSKLNFKHHYFGHHHKTLTIQNKHTCLYKKIKRIV